MTQTKAVALEVIFVGKFIVIWFRKCSFVAVDVLAQTESISAVVCWQSLTQNSDFFLWCTRTRWWPDRKGNLRTKLYLLYDWTRWREAGVSWKALWWFRRECSLWCCFADGGEVGAVYSFLGFLHFGRKDLPAQSILPECCGPLVHSYHFVALPSNFRGLCSKLR